MLTITAIVKNAAAFPQLPVIKNGMKKLEKLTITLQEIILIAVRG